MRKTTEKECLILQGILIGIGNAPLEAELSATIFGRYIEKYFPFIEKKEVLKIMEDGIVWQQSLNTPTQGEIPC